MGKKDTPVQAPVKVATAADAPETATAEQAAETAADTAETTAADEAAAAAPKAPAVEGSYTVASPIKHDGEDYEAGDTIRLPEATAARLAGYLKA